MAHKKVTVKEARNKFSELIERAAIAGDIFVITKFGKTKAVIAPLSSLTKQSPVTEPHKESDTGEVLKWTRDFVKQYRSALEALAKK